MFLLGRVSDELSRQRMKNEIRVARYTTKVTKSLQNNTDRYQARVVGLIVEGKNKTRELYFLDDLIREVCMCVYNLTMREESDVRNCSLRERESRKIVDC